MNKWGKILIGLGIAVVTTTLMVASGDNKDLELPSKPIFQDCGQGEVALDYPTERLCISENEYTEIKKELKKDYETPKDYDFEIDNRELLFAVLNTEIQRKGFQMEGNITKEKIKTELIKLLN